MLRFVPRAVLGAAVAVTTVACAAGAGEGPADSPEGTGGRYRVLVPALQAEGVQPRQAEAVANDLRSLISNMATHTAVPAGNLRRAMRDNQVEELDAITARQLAQLMNAQLVSWGTVQPGGEGLVANVTFTDVASGDQLHVEGATGSNPRELAQAVFVDLEQRLQGIALAAFCNEYLASQQFDRARETCERALEIVPNSSLALYGMATAYFHEDEFGRSLELYRRLLEVDPTHQDGLLGAGLAASRMEEPQEALGYYNRYLELNPGDVQVRMAVAGQIVDAGDVISAYRVLQPAVADNADNVDFQQYLASVATEAGRRAGELDGPAAAREYYETALRAYELVFAERGEEVEAAEMRRAIAVYLELGRTDEALRMAQDATSRFSDDAGVWAQYASVLNRAGQPAEEARALTRVAEINPQFENVFIRRAMAYQRAGQRQQALADLERAAQGGDREVVGQAIFGMAADELRRERWSEAENLLQMAHGYASGQQRSEISFYWGLSLYRQAETIARGNTQGRPDPARRALQLFQQAIPRLQASQNPQAAQVLSAARQYIENQEAIIQAARGR